MIVSVVSKPSDGSAEYLSVCETFRASAVLIATARAASWSSFQASVSERGSRNLGPNVNSLVGEMANR